MMSRRSPRRVTLLLCGCSFEGERWLTLCATHRAEFDELHARAMADYRNRPPLQEQLTDMGPR